MSHPWCEKAGKWVASLYDDYAICMSFEIELCCRGIDRSFTNPLKLQFEMLIAFARGREIRLAAHISRRARRSAVGGWTTVMLPGAADWGPARHTALPQAAARARVNMTTTAGRPAHRSAGPGGVCWPAGRGGGPALRDMRRRLPAENGSGSALRGMRRRLLAENGSGPALRGMRRRLPAGSGPALRGMRLRPPPPLPEPPWQPAFLRHSGGAKGKRGL